jgi:hypothetical protein
MHSMVTSAGGKALTILVVVSIGSLSQEQARYALSPELLDRHQEAQLVVYKNVLLSQIAPFDLIIKGLFLSNIDQHSCGLRHLTDLRAQLCMAGRRHLQLLQSSVSITGAW